MCKTLQHKTAPMYKLLKFYRDAVSHGICQIFDLCCSTLRLKAPVVVDQGPAKIIRLHPTIQVDLIKLLGDDFVKLLIKC